MAALNFWFVTFSTRRSGGCVCRRNNDNSTNQFKSKEIH